MMYTLLIYKWHFVQEAEYYLSFLRFSANSSPGKDYELTEC